MRRRARISSINIDVLKKTRKKRSNIITISRIQESKCENTKLQTTNSWNGNLLTTFEEHGAFVPSLGCMEISRSLEFSALGGGVYPRAG